MTRALIAALSLLLAAPVANATEPGALLLAQSPRGWCAYRDRPAFKTAAEAEGVRAIAEVTRPASGRIDVLTEAYSQAGDWRLTDRYRFTGEGGVVSRNAVILSVSARLDAEYRLANGKTTRVSLRHRHLENDGPPGDTWVPEIAIETAPSGFDFWPLVQAMDAQPDKPKLCRDA